MVEDNPKMNELEALYGFVMSHKDQIYIYGHDITAMNVSKYLFYADVKSVDLSSRKFTKQIQPVSRFLS